MEGAFKLILAKEERTVLGLNILALLFKKSEQERNLRAKKDRTPEDDDMLDALQYEMTHLLEIHEKLQLKQSETPSPENNREEISGKQG